MSLSSVVVWERVVTQVDYDESWAVWVWRVGSWFCIGWFKSGGGEEKASQYSKGCEVVGKDN